MLIDFSNLAPTRVSLRGIFWLYASKDGSGVSLAHLLVCNVTFFGIELLDRGGKRVSTVEIMANDMMSLLYFSL